MNRLDLSSGVFQLGRHISLVPVLHGSGDFGVEVRRIILSRRFDCIAVPIPSSFLEPVREAILDLPRIKVVGIEESTYLARDGDEEEGPAFTYVPIDPCQAVIMAIRIAMEEHIPVEAIDMETRIFRPESFSFPDPYSIKTVPLDRFAAALLPAIPRPSPETQTASRIDWMAAELKRLDGEYESVLGLCSIIHWPWIREAFTDGHLRPEEEESFPYPKPYQVRERSLEFVLGELPFITHLYEKSRADLGPDENLSVDGVKELVLEAREDWLRSRKRISNYLTPQRLQIYFQYARNLTLLSGRLTPDLYTLALAGKQVGGDDFAISIIETAMRYPGQEVSADEGIPFGIDQAELPEGGLAETKNRLEGQARTWKEIPLKRRPTEFWNKKYRQMWDPFGQCSWPPEDVRIESFNTHVRDEAKALIGADLARSEKFTASVKDGLDIRETLRNWHTGDLYVKVLPPSRGSIEVVVFLFEVPADPGRYTWTSTWYAEHDKESTLAFFSTPLGSEFVGPGIALCQYGGAMFLYPPRYIPDIWYDPRLSFCQTLEEQLIAGALLHTTERHIALVSPRPPSLSWRRIARRFGKRIIYLPLSRFSSQLVERLRYFHVLNGKQVRSFASHFIREM